MATKVLTGGCLCGHIRFEAKGIPQKPHTCSWGKGGKPRTWRSSDFSSRAFCPKCGSTLGALDDNPVVALTTGAFDKPQLLPLKPEYHSFKGARPKWWHVRIE
jgi:hypothetical protein